MEIKTDEEKDKISFEVCKVICKLLLTSGTTGSISTHCFLVLE